MNNKNTSTNNNEEIIISTKNYKKRKSSEPTQPIFINNENNNNNKNIYLITPIAKNNSEIVTAWVIERNPNYTPIDADNFNDEPNESTRIIVDGDALFGSEFKLKLLSSSDNDQTTNKKRKTIESKLKKMVKKNLKASNKQQQLIKATKNSKSTSTAIATTDSKKNQLPEKYIYTFNIGYKILLMNYQFEIKSIPNHLVEFFENCKSREQVYMKRKSFASIGHRFLTMCRDEIFSFLVGLTGDIKMTSSTLELTWLIYEEFMDLLIATNCFDNRKDANKLQLIAICCLSIASKLEETEQFQPSVVELNYSTGDQYTHDEITSMELNILTLLNFQVYSPCVSHFTEYLSLISVQPYDCKDENATGFGQLVKDFKSKLNQVKKIVIKNQSNRFELQSLMACASIAATRTILGVEPAWKPSLFSISNIPFNLFYHIYTRLIVDCNQQLNTHIIPEQILSNNNINDTNNNSNNNNNNNYNKNIISNV